MMQVFDCCPSCASTRIRPYAFTVEAERGRAIHFGQSHCRGCDLVFSNPMADREDLAVFYTSGYYEEVEQVYNAGRPDLEELVRRRAAGEVEGLRRILGPYVRSGVLFEIGAGYGSLLEAGRQLGFSVVGIEPSQGAAAFARETLGLEDVKTGIFDSREWPAEFCDAVYAFHVIEHVPHLHEFVGGIFRILRPGGVAFLGTESHHNSWVTYRGVRSWLRGRRLPEFQTSDHHTFYFSDRSLRYAFEHAGFEVLKTVVYTGTPGETLREKRKRYKFRNVLSKVAFYLMHFVDTLPGRGNRIIIWCRKPASSGTNAGLSEGEVPAHDRDGDPTRGRPAPWAG